MAVKSVSEFVYGVFFAVADIACHNADDIRIGDTVFLVDAVVAKDDVVLFPDLDYPVQHILLRRSAVKHYIALAEALAGAFCDGIKVFA